MAFNSFPYTNNHELNLDWFNEHFKQIFTEWENLYNQMISWKEDTDASLTEWKDGVVEDMTTWENNLLDALAEWKSGTSEDISEWERGVISDLNDWKETFLGAYNELSERVTAIVSDTEDMVENLAVPFSSSANYLKGEYVVQTGVLYRFTADHSAGAWTGSDAVQVTAMQDIDDYYTDEYFNEFYANNGIITITSDMLESGIWYKGNKQSNTARGRIKRLIPVKSGMRLNVEVVTFDVFYGIANDRTWTNYAQGGNSGTWLTSNTAINVTVDGYLVILIRNHADTTADVNVSNFNQNVSVETYIEKTFANNETSFLPRGVVANNTDLNSLRNPGTYILQNGYSYDNCPISSRLAGLFIIFKGSNNTFTEVVRTIALPPYSNEFQRTITLAATDHPNYSPWKRISGEYTIFPTGDNTDRTDEVTAALNAFKNVKFASGEFYLDYITLAEGNNVYGEGRSSIIRSLDTNYNAVFAMANDCSIHDLWFKGSDASARDETITDRNAIDFIGSGLQRGMIYNVTIDNFSGSGIKLSNTGTDISSHCIIDNVEISGCSAGINIDYSSEYHRISNCSVQRCWYGMVNNGGNNIISCCDFSGNIIGLLMEDNDGSAPNNTHGSIVGCTFNHSRSALGEANKGTAIKLTGLDYGEIFSACQVFFGSVIIDECVGIRFIGLNVGSSVPFTITDSYLITFSDSTFKEAANSATSPVTQSGNHSTLFYTNCYLRNGDVYNPV